MIKKINPDSQFSFLDVIKKEYMNMNSTGKNGVEIKGGYKERQ